MPWRLNMFLVWPFHVGWTRFLYKATVTLIMFTCTSYPPPSCSFAIGYFNSSSYFHEYNFHWPTLKLFLTDDNINYMADGNAVELVLKSLKTHVKVNNLSCDVSMWSCVLCFLKGSRRCKICLCCFVFNGRS